MGDSSEYIVIKAHPNFPGKTQSGFVLEHRQVWWENTGEDPTGYDIHHINGDKKDNRFENLEKLTRSEHMLKHSSTEMITLKCDNCGNEFERKLRDYKRSVRWKKTKTHFCSRKCIGYYSHYNKKKQSGVADR